MSRPSADAALELLEHLAKDPRVTEAVMKVLGPTRFAPKAAKEASFLLDRFKRMGTERTAKYFADEGLK